MEEKQDVCCKTVSLVCDRNLNNMVAIARWEEEKGERLLKE